MSGIPAPPLKLRAKNPASYAGYNDLRKVWKMRSVENVECGKCGVWKMWSVENAECGKCGVWKMRSVENAECRKCGV